MEIGHALQSAGVPCDPSDANVELGQVAHWSRVYIHPTRIDRGGIRLQYNISQPWRFPSMAWDGYNGRNSIMYSA